MLLKTAFEFPVIDVNGFPFWTLIVIVSGLGITFIISVIFNLLFNRRLKRGSERSYSLQTILVFMRRVILGAMMTLGISITLFYAFPNLGSAIASIFVAAGFASIVIGLAAQSTLSNILAGMMIALSQPFVLNDAVMFNNEFCYVEDIRLTYTILRTWDNRRLMVPNSLIQSQTIVNYTTIDATVLVPIFVTISYKSDSQKAMALMVDIAKNHPECLPVGDLPNAVIMDFDTTGVKLRLLSRAKDQSTAFSMTRNILAEVKKEFDKNGIEFPSNRNYVTLDPDSIELLRNRGERSKAGDM